jgi:hydrogenase maturation protein HypF
VVEGVAPGASSARLHGALVVGGAELVRRAVQHTGALPIVPTEGCFQNARLAEGILGALSGSLRVYLHEGIPPGDGGIALGQAVVADAMASG